MAGRFRRVDNKKGVGSWGAGDRKPGDRPKKPDLLDTSMDAQDRNAIEKKMKSQKELNEATEELDIAFGFPRHCDGPSRTAFMFNMRVSSLADEETHTDNSCLEFYFVQEDGKTFKAAVLFRPYFLITLKDSQSGTLTQECETFLNRRFEGLIASVEQVEKIDLAIPNHLSGITATMLKISFRNVQDLMAVRKVLQPRIVRNKQEQDALDAYEVEDRRATTTSILDQIIDIREYDVPYIQRVTIDTGYRVGLWYDVIPIPGSKGVDLAVRSDIEQRPLMKTCAFDIETTKLPLKFPNAEIDQVMMISYMLDGEGFLIVNREIVSADIEDFEYTPKPEYPGRFTVFNEPDELALLRRFFEHMRETSPLIYVTYNGDFFDWPFIEKRSQHHGLDLRKELAVYVDKSGEYIGIQAVHLDAFCWVKRDSYLPQGSQGLKAVTKAKLKYNPLELDPEDMLPFASEKPQVLASYSVSDAVATYFLYYKYIHLFIFSLATIIPMPPSDVLRKGSGTLCEVLLMTKAFEGKIICPDKQKTNATKFHKGHLLESETYIGGHVEALESGVFRFDLPYEFRLSPSRMDFLLERLDRTLHFAIKEANTNFEDIVNYDEVRNNIAAQLLALKERPNIEVLPAIYHLDVGAMYPNIILTNRLQPMAMVDQATCAACDFNRPGQKCQRKMKWSWRGKYFTATRSDYEHEKSQLEVLPLKDEPQKKTGGDWRGGGWQRKPVTNFLDLPEDEQAQRIKAQIKLYSQKAYKKITIEEVEEKEAIVCQRENPFYVDTVRAFRDRRYEYKVLQKKWGDNLKDAKSALDIEKAKDMILLYDSMQLAHKCILNSFYGYVMRAGARWQSIEMAGVVCLTGASIIQDARALVEDIGRPLELDTDGIWCMLPKTFPDNFVFKTKSSEAGKGRPLTISYPCNVLNYGVKENFSNDQYQTLQDEKRKLYAISSENSIFFEVDGPYAAMVLPASKEEGKSIKKRYAIFNLDGTLAELKGFEIKRRGELKLIKLFQGQVFKTFLAGRSLKECYDACGSVANHWLEVLYNKGVDLEDSDIFDLIGEKKNMSAALSEYGAARSTSITTAKRLGQFLGQDMVKDKGLCCSFIIANKPDGASVSDRAIPTAIFSAEEAVKKHFIRKWTGDSSLSNFDVRSLVDWSYYIERLSSAVQKIVTIPAAFQKIENPCPTVLHPDWLGKAVRARNSSHKQSHLLNFFRKVNSSEIEDIGASKAKLTSAAALPSVARVKRRIEVIEEVEGEEKEERKEGSSDDDDEDEEKTTDPIPPSDMLDEGEESSNSGSSSSSSALSPLKKSKVSDKHDDEVMFAHGEHVENEQPLVCPDEKTDFVGWLNFHKRNWKKHLAARRAAKARIQAGGSAYADGLSSSQLKARLRPGQGLMGYFLSAGKGAASARFWQIIQIVPDTPGSFRLWVFLDKADLRMVTVHVRRVLYLNYRIPMELPKKVLKILPRGRTIHNLYQLEMAESEFLENNKDLSGVLNHHEVEGVYESKLPLLFKLIMEAGCVCRATQSAENRSATEFDLEQLQFKTTAECPYLEDLTFSKIFIYHSRTETRGVFGVFQEGETEVMVIAVNPFTGQVEGNLRQLLREAAHSQEVEAPQLTFVVRQVADDAAAYRLIRDRLSALKIATTSPLVVLSQCVEGIDTLYSNIPSLKQDFPVVCIASTLVDNQYPEMMWFPHASRRMLERYLQLPQWWQQQMSVCNYAHIPIGNLESDYPAQVCDVLYSRALRQSNHLLWISRSPHPDLGGRAEDENALFEDEHVNPEIITPGCYRDVCMELDVKHLAVNTIIKSNLIEELEGGMGMHKTEADGESTGTVNSSYACQDAFNTLKSCVTNWLSDTARNKSEVADMLLMHFYRWLRSPSSSLYDPELHRLVHKLMTKVFRQLVQRFRKLGATVIYANFTKLTLGTGKPSVARAVAYSHYILETIKLRPLFQWLDVSPVYMWETLTFLDAANYGGIAAQGQAEGEEQQEGHAVVSHWNLAEYLPQVAQEYFTVVIGEMVSKPFEFARDHEESRQEGTEVALSADEYKQAFLAFIKDLVSVEISRRLFKITKDLHDHLGTNDPAAAFPRLAGSHLVFESPALEFVKSVTHVMALDRTVETEVANLKANLLRLIGVRPFSDQAAFKDPCLSFVLPDFICTYCNMCRDLDLCRDPDISNHEWKCSACQHNYSLPLIEAMLVSIVKRRSIAYQIQDLVCAKCHKVKMSNMSQHCPCSGKFVTEVSAEKFQQSVRAFYNIAQFHGFSWLEETVAFLRLG